MPRTWLMILIATALVLPSWAAPTASSAAPPAKDDKNNGDTPQTIPKDSPKDTPKEPAKEVKKFTGRPGELTEEEEDKIDKVVKRFIEFDTGANPRDKAALTELNKLGPEAIPSLIRGLNKSVQEGYSCPVTVIGNKLGTLIASSDDPKVLQFIRDELGAGVTKKSPYDGVLGNLKLKAIYRKRKVDEEIAKAAASPGDKTSPGNPDKKSPGDDKPK